MRQSSGSAVMLALFEVLAVVFAVAGAATAVLLSWLGLFQDEPKACNALLALTGGCIFLSVLMRVPARHPAGNKQYRRWLETSPWSDRLPPPLGPATPAWKDALLMLG